MNQYWSKQFSFQLFYRLNRIENLIPDAGFIVWIWTLEYWMLFLLNILFLEQKAIQITFSNKCLCPFICPLDFGWPFGLSLLLPFLTSIYIWPVFLVSFRAYFMTKFLISGLGSNSREHTPVLGHWQTHPQSAQICHSSLAPNKKLVF